MYEVHEFELTNRCLADHDARQKLWQFLMELADVVDPVSGKDVQAATIRAEINAAAGSLDRAARKARDAGASWVAREASS